MAKTELVKIYSLIFFVFGFLFNSISIIVYYRKKLIKTSMSTYFIIYCISKTILLFINFLNVITNKLSCKMVLYSIFLFSDFSNGILSLASIDRLIVFKANVECIKKWFQFLIIGIIFVSLSAANVPAILYAKSDDHTNLNCSLLNSINEHKNSLSFFNIFDTLLFLVIHFIIMISCSNVMIIRLFKLRKMKKLITLKIQNQKKSILLLWLFQWMLCF